MKTSQFEAEVVIYESESQKKDDSWCLARVTMVFEAEDIIEAANKTRDILHLDMHFYKIKRIVDNGIT